MYERLLANTQQVDPDNPQSCWIWTGRVGNRGYPHVTQRNAHGVPTARPAHRIMLREVLRVEFPFDEGGHLCFTPLCIHPCHLEVQTQNANLGERRGYGATTGCMIPVLFPLIDPLQVAADAAWDRKGRVVKRCPF